MAFILRPRNVRGVVIAKQDPPRRPGLPVSDGLAGAAVDDPRARFRFAEDVRAGVHRIGEDAEDAVIDRQLPNERGFAGISRKRRQGDLLLPIPQEDLSRAPEPSGNFWTPKASRKPRTT